jgi:hypothetical protein
LGGSPKSKNMKGNRVGKNTEKFSVMSSKKIFKPHRKLKLISRWRGLKKNVLKQRDKKGARERQEIILNAIN